MARQSSIHGSSLPVPSIRPVNLGAAGFVDMQYGINFQGFVGDGDRIKLPINNTSINYYNAAGADQWAGGIARTDIHADADDWAGFTFDGTLIWCVAIDTAANPGTYYLATIDVAGTVVKIGAGVTPVADFDQNPPGWTVAYSTDGSTHIQIDPVSGNILVGCKESTGYEEMVLNATTGAIESQISTIHGDLSGRICIKSQDADFYYYQNSTSLYVLGNTTGSLVLRAVDPLHGHFTWATGFQVVWNDRLYMCNQNTTAIVSGPRIFDLAEYEAWVKTVFEVSQGYTI